MGDGVNGTTDGFSFSPKGLPSGLPCHTDALRQPPSLSVPHKGPERQLRIGGMWIKRG